MTALCWTIIGCTVPIVVFLWCIAGHLGEHNNIMMARTKAGR